MSRLHAIAIGVRTAWRVPAWIAEAEAADLLATEWPREWSDDLPRSEIEAASSAAWLTLRLLARLHPGRWKTSCLYRSAAECQLLREFGVPASVRLGVHREGGGPIAAHAWVETPGARPAADQRYARFHRASDVKPGRV